MSGGECVWNDWRKCNPEIGPELQTRLQAIDLKPCNLRDADFRGALLLGADISEAARRISRMLDCLAYLQ